MLIGTDGGIYESFDDSETWKFVANLPLTQFYKLAVDDAYPFYNILLLSQDNKIKEGRQGISKIVASPMLIGMLF